MQRFVVGMRRRQFPQFRYDVGGAAEQQVGLGPCAGGLLAQRVGAGGGGPVREVGERGPAPQGERLGEVAGGGGRVAPVEGGRTPAGEVFEDEQVHVVPGRREAVAAGVGGDRVLAEGAAEAADQGLEGGRGVLGRLVRPHLVDQGADGDDPARVQGESGEQGAQPRTAEGYAGALFVLRPGAAQDSVPHRAIVAGRAGRGHGVSRRGVRLGWFGVVCWSGRFGVRGSLTGGLVVGRPRLRPAGRVHAAEPHVGTAPCPFGALSLPGVRAPADD